MQYQHSNGGGWLRSQVEKFMRIYPESGIQLLHADFAHVDKTRRELPNKGATSSASGERGKQEESDDEQEKSVDDGLEETDDELEEPDDELEEPDDEQEKSVDDELEEPDDELEESNDDLEKTDDEQEASLNDRLEESDDGLEESDDGLEEPDDGLEEPDDEQEESVNEGQGKQQLVVGQNVRCLWKGVDYGAKIVKKWEEGGRSLYRVHYIGWKSTMDETMDEAEALQRFHDWDPKSVHGFYVVESIIGKRVRKVRNRGVVEYLVHWKDFDSSEDTWESERKLISDGCFLSIEKYENESRN